MQDLMRGAGFLTTSAMRKQLNYSQILKRKLI